MDTDLGPKEVLCILQLWEPTMNGGKPDWIRGVKQGDLGGALELPLIDAMELADRLRARWALTTATEVTGPIKAVPASAAAGAEEKKG